MRATGSRASSSEASSPSKVPQTWPTQTPRSSPSSGADLADPMSAPRLRPGPHCPTPGPWSRGWQVSQRMRCPSTSPRRTATL
eukprot:4439471-Prymnesium_polylepis.1